MMSSRKETRVRSGLGAWAVATLLAAGAAFGQEGGGGGAPRPPEQAGKPIDAAPADRAVQRARPLIRFGAPTPIAKPEGMVRIATYNVENLFDDKDDPALSGNEEDKDNTKPDDHCKAAAAAIKLIDADVIALQEVESKDALLWFRDKYLADLGYQYVESVDAGDERGIEQGVLSRFPLSNVKNWPGLSLGGEHPSRWGRGSNERAGKPITFHRSPLRVMVSVPPPEGAGDAAKPYTLTMFVVHQKSGQPGGYWREREAARTVELIKEVQASDPNANIVLLGDFNAQADERPIQTFTGAGMIDVFAPVRKKGEPLYTTHASGRAIDFIFLNSAAAKELVPETRFILGTSTRAAGVDYRTTPAPEGYASDHYPVVIDLVPMEKE